MILLAILTAPAAASAMTPAENGTENIENPAEEHVAAAAIPAPIGDEAQRQHADDPVATPVKLVSWDGDFELLKTSRRMRIWRSHIAYSLTVGADGKAIGCELTETFRMRRVSDRLCDVLMAHHTFEPAHDASGAPVEGTYSSRISYADMQSRP